jgi:hypothetical protein
MKRALKIVIGSVLFGAVLIWLWCLLAPILFPQRVKAANDKYQAWIADHPAPKK